MKTLIKIALHFLPYFLVCLLSASAALAQSTKTESTIQDPAQTRQVAEQFLRSQAASLPGDIHIVIGKIDPRMQFAACNAPEAFMPPGSRTWGKTTVGVRCKSPAPWTVYIPATVHVTTNYLVTANPLSQGKIIGQDDIRTLKGDLATLPAGTLTDPAQAIGRIIAVSTSSGIPLRQDTLRSQQAVQQGQIVRLVSNGPGFKISVEAKAMTGGNEGQLVQAKTSAGQIINGIARVGGIVEVTY
jgi:flagella basal body P-ring formation protein FlgA